MGKGRAPCCDKTKVKKGPWSPAEDLRLTNFIQKHGHSNWRALPKQAGLLRCGKSCRLRWINYLRPDVKRGNFTPQEEQTIINLHNSIGNKWSKIASCLPGRTDNEIKNVWNTHLKKRVVMAKKCAPEEKNYSASLSCTSSSPGDTKSAHSGDHHHEEKEASISEYSPTSSHGSINFSNPTRDKNPAEASEFPGSEPDDGKIEIPLESDIDFWELFDSLGPGQTDPNEVDPGQGISNPGEKLEWFRLLENELGLTSDVDQNMEMNLEPEISRPAELDYFPIWPCSPQNLGI